MVQKLLSKIRSFSLKPVNDSERQKKLMTFRVMLFVTCGIVFLLFCSLLQKDNVIANTVSEVKVFSQTDKLFQYDEQLHKRLDKLQQLDEQYASFVNMNATIHSLDSLNTVIHQEEDYFNAVIEKINQNIGLFTDENNMRQFVKMIASFRSIISSRPSLNSLRNAVASRINDAGTNGYIMTSTETADERERRVRSIEAAAKDDHTTDASREHTQEMAVLKENINDLENKVASLTAANDDLKQVNKRLSKEQAETKIILKKARNLQERIDVLNAEIQLTRVDCNLLKMDAVATDYDASQKKRLISESSLILAGLSGSDNAAIRRKAKDKVVLLNHIAAARE